MAAVHSSVALKKVLFPTDFSEESAHAIDYVRALRHGYNAKICVLHVADLFPYSLSDDPVATQKASSILHQAEARIRDFMLVHRFDRKHFEPAVVSGEVFEAVAKFVAEHEIDLVLLGSRGDLGISRLFLGSVAEEIFRTARCPVMTVGPQAHAPEKDGRFNRLLFATDFSEHSQSALPYVEFLLADNPQAKLTLAHFHQREEKELLSRHQEQRNLEDQLRSLVPDTLQDRIADVIVAPGPAAGGMVKLATQLEADLLILGVRYGGSFLRIATHGPFSVTQAVIGRAPCPVFTVRGPRSASISGAL
ncbi:MAG: universal stress protein [Acidobacteriia bacterium]|nr:universal stress protein [Terriglobia bacterium]